MEDLGTGHHSTTRQSSNLPNTTQPSLASAAEAAGPAQSSRSQSGSLSTDGTEGTDGSSLNPRPATRWPHNAQQLRGPPPTPQPQDTAQAQEPQPSLAESADRGSGPPSPLTSRNPEYGHRQTGSENADASTRLHLLHHSISSPPLPLQGQFKKYLHVNHIPLLTMLHAIIFLMLTNACKACRELQI